MQNICITEFQLFINSILNFKNNLLFLLLSRDINKKVKLLKNFMQRYLFVLLELTFSLNLWIFLLDTILIVSRRDIFFRRFFYGFIFQTFPLGRWNYNSFTQKEVRISSALNYFICY